MPGMSAMRGVRMTPDRTATRGSTGVHGALRAFVEGLVERPLFSLPRSRQSQLRYEMLHPGVRTAFMERGYALAENSRILKAGGAKWRLQSGKETYAIRSRNGQLVVSLEKRPVLAWLIRQAANAADFLRYRLRAGLREEAFYIRAWIRKRFIDTPTKVMINVGAGKWHSEGWKVLDYSRGWYRYSRLFVDYPHDLMSEAPLPFDRESVDVFYTEHVLEHLPDDRVQHLLGEMNRALRVGGGVRIVVPDADLIYDRFRAKDAEFFRSWMDARGFTFEEAFLNLVADPRQAFDEGRLWEDVARLPREEFLDELTKSLKYDYSRAGEHINWFNYGKLRRMLTMAGFGLVFLSGPQESRLEEATGLEFDTRPSYSLHVDALK